MIPDWLAIIIVCGFMFLSYYIGESIGYKRGHKDGEHAVADLVDELMEKKRQNTEVL